MHKKGQIGKTITNVVVLFWVIVIIGVFIFLAAGARVLKNPGDLRGIAFERESEGKNLLLQEIEVDIDGKMEKMLVFDSVIKRIREENLVHTQETEKAIIDALSKLLNEQLNCAGMEIYGRDDSKPYFITGVQYNGPDLPISRFRPSLFYVERGGDVEPRKNIVLVDGQEIIIESFYQHCLTSEEREAKAGGGG